MRNKTDFKKYIPLDKSWIIRIGVLDIINGYHDIEKFLAKQKDLGDDLLALRNISKIWQTNKAVNVGESGTLYRIIKFASWKLKLNKKFIIGGTLKNRKINDDSSIINLSQKELLKLDNNTSQWATASVLLGDKERLENSPFKLKLTYEAVSHWNKQRKSNETWEPHFDETILNQAKTYLKLLKGQKAKFNPEQAEDFCFAHTFDFITAEEGEKRWPSLRNHESDRIFEMKKVMGQAKRGEEIISKDHRVIQAIVMWGKVNKKEIKIKFPSSVNKSWPQFWDFIKNNI
jgi:hypothetical protein